MQISKFAILSAFAAFSATTNALKATHELGLQLQGTCQNIAAPSVSGRAINEKRACRWGGCDACYDNEPICQVCAEEGDNLAACIVW